jgi:hypothetical protein
MTHWYVINVLCDGDGTLVCHPGLLLWWWHTGMSSRFSVVVMTHWYVIKVLWWWWHTWHVIQVFCCGGDTLVCHQGLLWWWWHSGMSSRSSVVVMIHWYVIKVFCGCDDTLCSMFVVWLPIHLLTQSPPRIVKSTPHQGEVFFIQLPIKLTADDIAKILLILMIHTCTLIKS